MLLDSNIEEDKQIEFMFLSWALCCDERLAMLCGALDGECTELLQPAYSNDMQLYYWDYLAMMQMDKNDNQFLVFFNGEQEIS